MVKCPLALSVTHPSSSYQNTCKQQQQNKNRPKGAEKAQLSTDPDPGELEFRLTELCHYRGQSQLSTSNPLASGSSVPDFNVT